MRDLICGRIKTCKIDTRLLVHSFGLATLVFTSTQNMRAIDRPRIVDCLRRPIFHAQRQMHGLHQTLNERR